MSNPKPPMRRREFAQILAGVFLVVFPVRLALVLMIAPEIPFYDEWDAVIDGMARPMLAGNLSLQYLLVPHNEHLVLWTKGLNYLALLAGDMQFDNVPVCEVSQFIYAGIVATLIALGANNLDGGLSRPSMASEGRSRPSMVSTALGLLPGGSWFIASACAVAVVPYGWENIGMGWGNSYYFLLGFGAATIILASVMRGSARALLLLGIFAMASGVSMGSGFFADLAALFALTLRVRIGTLSVRGAVRAGAVLVVAAASAAALIVRSGRVSADWGVLQSTELAVLLALSLPTWILLLRIWRGQGMNADVAFVCVSVWGLMQICAILLGRPAFRLWFPISRYVEVLAAAGFANLGCLLRISIAAPERRPLVWLARAALLATIIATFAFAPFAWQRMEARAEHQREQASRLVRYVHAGDSDAIESAPVEDLPYPERDRLRSLLDAPDVRLILGDRAGTRAAPSVFVQNVRSVNAALVRNGAWLLPLGLALGLLSLSAAFRARTSAVAPSPAPGTCRRP